VDWGEILELSARLLERVLCIAYDSVKRDFSKKTSVFIYQGGGNMPNFGASTNDIKIIEFANEITIEIPKSRLIKGWLEDKKPAK
jgi:hypothetical protein